MRFNFGTILLYHIFAPKSTQKWDDIVEKKENTIAFLGQLW